MEPQAPSSNYFSQERRWLRGLHYLVFGGLVLYFGREVFIPLSFALLISFVLYPVCVWLERRGIGRLSAILLSLSLLLMLGILLVSLLVSQFLAFLEDWSAVQPRLMQALQEGSQVLSKFFGLSKMQQTEIVAKLLDLAGSSLLLFLRNALSVSAVSAVLLVLIPIYSFLILYNRAYWLQVIGYLFPAEDQANLRRIIRRSIHTYYSFIKGVVLVYLIVGVLNSIGLLLLGVPYAIFFGFIASVLTFIPFVGIMVGSLLPITMSWLTYDSLWYPLGVIAIFTFVQYLEANLIFPVVVSRRLHVNTLVMLLAIFVGGMLWGVAGMILFVPFVGILKLLADHVPEWKLLSLILGMESKKKAMRSSRKSKGVKQHLI